jgi:Uma2 family endonuclease
MPVMSGPQRKLTYADLLSFPDDGNRHEIIDGVHYVTPCPKFSHQELLGRLFLSIANFLATRRHLGWVVLSPFDVVMSEHDIVEPDLLFIAGDQKAIITEANVQGPPALVVEILSPSTRRRDEGIKRRLFDSRGVREYWMVDLKGRRVLICRRAPDGTFPIVETLTLAWDGKLTTPLLPDWSLPLSDLFAEL